MVAKIASKPGECGINIENMANKARGNHAYTIVETNDTIDQAAIEEIRRAEASLCPRDPFRLKGKTEAAESVRRFRLF